MIKNYKFFNCINCFVISIAYLLIIKLFDREVKLIWIWELICYWKYIFNGYNFSFESFELRSIWENNEFTK
jgi:hypothetical protein